MEHFWYFFNIIKLKKNQNLGFMFTFLKKMCLCLTILNMSHSDVGNDQDGVPSSINLMVVRK